MKTKTFGMSEYMYTCNYQGQGEGGGVGGVGVGVPGHD